MNIKKILLASFLVLPFIVGCGVPDRYKFEGEIGSRGSGKGEFNAPVDMAINGDEELVVSDSGNNRLQVLTTDGTMKLTAGEYGTTGFKLQSLGGCGVHPRSGEMLICDVKGNKVVKFDKNGSAKTKFTERVKSPMDASFDKDGKVYVIMGKQPFIFRYNVSGKFEATIGGTGNSALVFPVSLMIRDDFIYVADSEGRRVVKLTLKGDFVSSYTTKGEFEPVKGPCSVYVDNTGYLYILDIGEVPLVTLNPEGKFLSKIGYFGESAGGFMYPKSIVAKENGEVFVLDYSKNTILRFKKS